MLLLLLMGCDVISHEYFGSNTRVSLCEIRLRYRYNDNISISPFVLRKIMMEVMQRAMRRVLAREQDLRKFVCPTRQNIYVSIL